MELIIKVSIFTLLLEYCLCIWTVCPKDCQCVKQSVDCSNRGFKEFPTYFPLYTTYLNFSGNELHYLPEVLQNLQDLADLNLAWNQLHIIPETTFQKLWKLEKLDLSGNKFQRLTDIRGVYHAYRLLELDVSNNPIKETGQCSPENAIYSETIFKLDLSKTVLTTINPCAFLWLSNLTHLSLSGNPIQQLTQIISNSLVQLDVSNCDIHFITTKAFDKLPSLKHLNLSRNVNLKIHTPFNNGYMSESLEYLDISSCGLNEPITDVFPHLEYASFKGNFIRGLTPRLFYRNRQLSILDLSENLIETVSSGAFYGAESLTSLDLSSNFINEFQPETFSHLYKLNKLIIARNPLYSLRHINAPSLRYLDGNSCDITEVSSFINTPDLMYLNLSNNPIEYLPEWFHFNSLTQLDLSYCRITKIGSETFNNLKMLKYLDLRGNRLTHVFHKPILDTLSNLNEILVTNNPWRCDCNTTHHKEFLKFVMNRSPKKNYQDLTCLMPESQLQMSWTKSCDLADEKEVRRFKSERQWMAFLITFATMSTVVLVLLVLRHNMSNTPRDMSQEDVNGSQPHLETSYPVRSPIADILQLPTYEEAILLPKPTNLTSSSSTHVITREVGTWTSTHSLNNDNTNDEILCLNCDDNQSNDNSNDDENNSICSTKQYVLHVSSTSL